MNKARPLFVTGTARSGSTLLSQILSVNKEIMVASDPYFPLFRSLRNAIIHYCGSGDLLYTFEPMSPLQDYYFTDERIRVMDTIQSANLNIPFNSQEWPQLLEAIRTRSSYECVDLAPYLDKLIDSNYREIVENGLNIVASARQARSWKWVGIKEVWTVEFFAPLASTFPEARFIILLRDPRAIIASMLAIEAIDTAQVSHILSYARHWRKYAAFALHYQLDPLFEKRLHVLTYEQLVSEPEQKVRELCDFLQVDYTSEMLDTNQFVNFSHASRWQGNSSFGSSMNEISIQPLEYWRSKLKPEVLKLIDFICGPEMQLLGYETVTLTANQWPDPEIFDFLLASHQADYNWRSDLGDLQQDYGFELFRYALLSLPDTTSLDLALIRRSFLFTEVFTQLQKVWPKRNSPGEYVN